MQDTDRCPLCMSERTRAPDRFFHGSDMAEWYQKCRSESCGLPCRLWDEVRKMADSHAAMEFLRGHGGILSKRYSISRHGKEEYWVWACCDGEFRDADPRNAIRKAAEAARQKEGT